MKKSRYDSDRIGIFGKLKKKIGDFFYDIQVLISKKIPQKQKSQKHRRIGETIFYWSILVLPLVQFLIMYVGVNLNSILLAFRTYKVNLDGTSTLGWAGFDNFSMFIDEILGHPIMKTRIVNSLIVYAVNLFVGTVLAILFSYYIYKKYIGTEFFRIMLLLPSICSPVVLVIIYTYVADRAVPAIFGIQSLLSGTPQKTFVFIIIYNILMGFGMGVLMYSNIMARIPDSLVEYAKLEGAKPLEEFFKITLPLIYPTIETFLIIGVANIFINQASLFTFFVDTAHPSLQTVGYYLFTQVFSNRSTMSNYPYASAAGLTLTLITIPIVMLARHFLDKLNPGIEF